MTDLRATRKVYTFLVGPAVSRITAESASDAMVRMNRRMDGHVANFYGWAEGSDPYTFKAMFGAWD